LSNSAALAALIGGQGAGDQPAANAPDPLNALQNCIQDLHGLMQVMPDAKHTQQIHQSLAPLLAIQSELSQASQGNPRQQLLQQLSGQ
jgi:hypothetical protein